MTIPDLFAISPKGNRLILARVVGGRPMTNGMPAATWRTNARAGPADARMPHFGTRGAATTARLARP
ncbi:hypothetical protein MQC88_10825 [Luteimonas sp. 50]|uniref:Uncharacterized protein n=1 Tax=Cognatiluteimonas sedimenti TaxID=2927791 RepID=A0ABT0A638_9GAMM|nr:hypothetical protein [Lysobacter sedimenti]MCJ0826437.1 hypothetical protein [Lysobacter sedimenti]